MLKEPLAEFFGVMIIILFGAGVDCQVVLSGNSDVASSQKVVRIRILPSLLPLDETLPPHCTPTWFSLPSLLKPPPAPRMTTQFPDSVFDFLRALYTVTPAQSMGAAAAESTPSGIGVT